MITDYREGCGGRKDGDKKKRNQDKYNILLK